MGDISDADRAMERYADGDSSAFALLYDAIAPRLFGYLVRHCRDETAARDLLQHTMLHLHRARGTFRKGAAVMPWAYAIARRLILDGARRSKLESRQSAPTEELSYGGPDEHVAATQLLKRVQRVLFKLPEAQRTAYELVKQEGLTAREAAEVLGWTLASVKLRVHRADVAVRAALVEGGPSGPA